MTLAVRNSDDTWAALHVICADDAIRAHREEIAVRILEHFERHFLISAQPRVVCILDDQDHWELKQEFGGVANRGVHWPIHGQGIFLWPGYAQELIAYMNSQSDNLVWSYASVVYLHGSTCESDVGLTLTLAHELQHFLQFAHKKSLWAANTLLINLRNEEFKVWWDFPIEIEARITAKRIAEELFGRVPVNGYILDRIATRVTENDAEDWKFVQSIDSAVPYDLADATCPLVRRHKAALEALLISRKSDPDFATVDLDAICRVS